MFALKFPLIERIIEEGTLRAGRIVLEVSGLTPDRRRQIYHEGLFATRRNLWKRGIPELRAIIEKIEAAKARRHIA